MMRRKSRENKHLTAFSPSKKETEAGKDTDRLPMIDRKNNQLRLQVLYPPKSTELFPLC